MREEINKVKQEMTDNKKGLADADLTILTKQRNNTNKSDETQH